MYPVGVSPLPQMMSAPFRGCSGRSANDVTPRGCSDRPATLTPDIDRAGSPVGLTAGGSPGAWPAWRTTAARPEAASRGRETAKDGSPAQQAERDRFWQSHMHAERKASGVTVEQEEQGRGGKAQPLQDIGRGAQLNASGGPAQGVAAELRRIDPSGLVQVSPALSARCTALSWRLEHLGATIGTVIHGPDLRLPEMLTAEAIDTIYSVLLERKVVCFRGQHGLTEAQHIAFGRRFGQLEVFPFAVREGSDPDILPLRSAGPIATGASGWHSDVTWRKTPSLGSMLYCEQAPAFGGATGFVDCYAAFQGLPADQREALRGRVCVHDFDGFRQVGD